MSSDERYVFHERAKTGGYGYQRHYPREAIKYTSLGVPMRYVDRERKIKEEQNKKAKQTIESIIELATAEDRKYIFCG